MCNLSWTPHSNLEKDNSLNHSCVSPKMGCLEYTNKELRTNYVVCMSPGVIDNKRLMTLKKSLPCDSIPQHIKKWRE